MNFKIMQKAGRKSIYFPVKNEYGLDVYIHANKNYGIHRVDIKNRPDLSAILTSRMQGRQANSMVVIDHLKYRIGELV